MFAAVRIRGKPDTNSQIEDTLTNLGLEQKNHCLLLPEEDHYEGMLKQVKDAVTYGRIDEETAAHVLRERGETDHGPLSSSLDELGYDSVEDLVSALEEGDVNLSELKDDGFRNVVRLNPPSKGYKSTKQHYRQGGALGDRGEAIQELLGRMA